MQVKKKRIVDQDFLEYIKTLPCLISGKIPSDADHIVTRGHGGDDVANNVWPISREYHVERHKIGLITFIKKYPVLQTWLELADRHDILEKLK